MSSLEPGNGSPELEESPDPEADSGLPQRHLLSGEGMDVKGVEECAEEDLTLALETVVMNSESIPDQGEHNLGLLADIQENSMSEDVERDSKDTGVSSAELSGSGEEHVEQNPGIIAVPDCNVFGVDNVNGTTKCIDTDRQLLHSQEAISSHHGSSTLGFVNDVYEFQGSKLETYSQCSFSEFNDARRSSDTIPQDDLKRNCIVAGAADLGTRVYDATETDEGNVMWGSAAYSCEDEVSLNLFVTQDVSTALDYSLHITSSQLLDEAHDKADIDLEIIITENIPIDKNNDLAMIEIEVREPQVSECEKEGPLDKTQSGACLEPPVVTDAELTSLVQASLDDTSDYPALTAEQNALGSDQDPISYESAESVPDFGTVDSHEDLSAAIDEAHDKADIDLEIIKTENIPIDKNNDLAMMEIEVREPQVSECDKEGSLDKTQSGACLEPPVVTDAELTSLVQASLDDTSDYPVLTAEQNALGSDQDPISYESVESVPDFGTVDSHEDLSAAISFCEASHDAKVGVSEYQKIMTSAAILDQDEINITHVDQKHFSSSVDNTATQTTDSTPSHQQNISHRDHFNDKHLPQAISQYNEQQTVQPANEPLYLHDSTSTQPPSAFVSLNINEHRSLNSNYSSYMQASESSSDDCSSATSPILSAMLPTMFFSSVEEPRSSNISSQLQAFDSSSDDSSPALSQPSSPAKTLSYYMSVNSHHIEKENTSSLQSGNGSEVFRDREAELYACTLTTESTQRPVTDRYSELRDSENAGQIVNGLQPLFDIGQIEEYNRQLLEQMRIRDDEIAKLTYQLTCTRGAKGQAVIEEQHLSPSHQADDLYLPQIKMLEHTIAQQQKEIEALKLKLTSQDGAAKKAITSLQNELKSRVNQVTKMYEECRKEKDTIVVRYAESEAKNMEAKRIADKSEAKVKEAMKDKETAMNAMKAAKMDRQKALSNFETKCIEISNLQKEIEKLKEAVNSSDHRVKWFQNKLTVETDDHKETKSNLEKTVAKLKEAREETEVIRKECHAIVKRYQESEEIKSNSLDKELKLKETELRTQMQERDDSEEIHQMLKRELDSLKSQHKDNIEEAKTYKDKVQCLEDERRQNHLMIENYQEIMQRQKTSNAELNVKITSMSTLEEDYKCSQELLQTLEKDIADLRVANQELQKDMESCRNRECRMLGLQSELSHTNALLRSENTGFSIKISALTGELGKLKMEVQTLESAARDLNYKFDKEKAQRKEEGEKTTSILAEKTKECNDIRQKWEDEIDNCKTLKRRHANNIKDLTRQLHQVHKRLEVTDGRADAGSMGSRNNSNGSLNSLENSSRLTFSTIHQTVQEFPAITEQVEVDKQVLIERIVRLQKSLARKNEKLEFLGEHIQQLLEDIKKKNKVIQCYALREESGTLSSEDMDANKSLLARKGGIMASLYSAQQQDGSMTLELSLQISRKLQAVLEDTLLKNMTLQESLDTLGEEIARLSQENRKLQLHLQKLEGTLA